MKKLLYLLLLIPILNFGQDFQWARHIEGIEHETADAIEIDSNGNSYIFGTSSTLLFDIDPTNDQQIIDNTSNNAGTSSQTIYLMKLDADGAFVWGQSFGTFSYYDKAIDIKIDTDGNIYLLAMTGEYNLSTSIYHNYITIIKLNQNGNILLTKRLTNLNNPAFYKDFSAASFDLDNQNNIYITGHFAYFLKLNETNPLFDLSSGYKDSFLLKLDNTGNLIFARKFDINYTNIHFERVNVAPDGNLNLLLSNGDNQSLTNYGYNVLKVNSLNGNIIWQKYFDNQHPTVLNTDNNGNIIIAGQGKNSYGPQIDVDPSVNQILIPPTKYILWLDSNGIFIDAKSYTSPGIGPTMFFSKIISDSNNNTYVIGNFYFQFDADPSPNTFMLVNTSLCSDIYHCVFSIKFDNNRDFVNAFKFGQYSTYCSNVRARDIKIHNDYQYYVGDFGHSYIDLDPSTNDYTFNVNPINSPYGDGYILKLGPCDSLMPNADNNQIFCSSQNPTVSNLSPNSSSIRYYDSLTSSISLDNNTTLINGQTYYASKQIGSCPESPRASIMVTINQSPSAPITSNQTFCESENAMLSNLLVTGQNIKFYDSLTNGNLLSNTTILSDNTNYYVSQTVNGCESTRTIINTTITPSPIPIVISPQSFCIQQNATINDIIINGQNIKWYDSETGGNLLSSSTILVDGMTYYTSQTLNSCESSRIPITIQIQDTSAPTGSNQSFCTVQNPTLNNVIINGSAIKWYSDNISTTELPLTTSLTDNVTYYASQTLNGCESTTRLPITISLISTLNANDYSSIICDDGNNGTEITNLTSFNSFLMTSLQGNTFTYYKSLNGAENQISSEQLNNNHSIQSGVNTIFVRIDSSNGCHQIVQLQLTLVNVPEIPILNEITLCETGIVSVNAGSGFNSYTWSNNATTQSIVINQAGNYWITVTKNHNSTVCSTTKNFSVILSNKPTITSINTIDWTDFENSITVNVTGLGNYEYSIDGINFQESPVFNGLSNGVYTVTVKDTKECGIAKKQVYLLNYPKFFTPNGDGHNDTWKVKFSQFEENFVTQIFDRYGKLIKVLNNHESWDGTYNGKQLPSDDYWFQITRNDGRIHRGHFAMIR